MLGVAGGRGRRNVRVVAPIQGIEVSSATNYSKQSVFSQSVSQSRSFDRSYIDRRELQTTYNNTIIMIDNSLKRLFFNPNETHCHVQTT